MPMYEYKCRACEHYFKESYKIAEREVPESEACPDCGESAVKKVITGILGFQADVPPKLNGDFKEVMKGIKKASGRENSIPDY